MENTVPERVNEPWIFYDLAPTRIAAINVDNKTLYSDMRLQSNHKTFCYLYTKSFLFSMKKEYLQQIGKF